MNWNSPPADEVFACAFGLRLNSTLAAASRYWKFVPVSREAFLMAPVTLAAAGAGVVSVASTAMALPGLERSQNAPLCPAAQNMNNYGKWNLKAATAVAEIGMRSG